MWSSSLDKVIIVPNFVTVKKLITIFKTLKLLNERVVTILVTLNKINELLKQQNKKQKDLTDFLGLSKNAYTNWKNGNNNSYMKHLPQIADFLNVSVDFLLGKENNAAENSDEALMFALYGGEHQDITPVMLDKVREFARFVREEEKRKNNDA